ncbi:hypothetical protein W909_13345 [Dickeya zeae EC1]|nr:hypothetical protein W909_13345 [Dickeya zeae EC1]
MTMLETKIRKGLRKTKTRKEIENTARETSGRDKN